MEVIIRNFSAVTWNSDLCLHISVALYYILAFTCFIFRHIACRLPASVVDLSSYTLSSFCEFFILSLTHFEAAFISDSNCI